MIYEIFRDTYEQGYINPHEYCLCNINSRPYGNEGWVDVIFVRHEEDCDRPETKDNSFLLRDLRIATNIGILLTED